MNLDRLRYLSDVMPANCFTLMSSPETIRELAAAADVIVCAVLIPGAKAPRLITRDMLKTMKTGSILNEAPFQAQIIRRMAPMKRKWTLTPDFQGLLMAAATCLFLVWGCASTPSQPLDPSSLVLRPDSRILIAKMETEFVSGARQ
jgi:hypothetical protein